MVLGDPCEMILDLHQGVVTNKLRAAAVEADRYWIPYLVCQVHPHSSECPYSCCHPCCTIPPLVNLNVVTPWKWTFTQSSSMCTTCHSRYDFPELSSHVRPLDSDCCFAITVRYAIVHLCRPGKVFLLSVNLQTQMIAMTIDFGKVPNQGNPQLLVSDQALLARTSFHGYPDMLV